MQIRSLLLLFLALGLWTPARPLPAASPARSPRPDVTWSVERRDLPDSGWRRRLAVGRQGTLWIGGDVVPSDEGGGLLLRKQAGIWSSLHVLPRPRR